MTNDKRRIAWSCPLNAAVVWRHGHEGVIIAHLCAVAVCRFDWASRGVYLGQRRMLLQLHVDDWCVFVLCRSGSPGPPSRQVQNRLPGANGRGLDI